MVAERAAVAVVLRDGENGVEVLLVRRAVQAGDPWSGHVAFPGGRKESGDRDTVATARRETLEETGLDLSAARKLGGFSGELSWTRYRARFLAIEPVVFGLLSPAPPMLTLSREVVRTFWVPLSVLTSGRHDGTTPWHLGWLTVRLPCWQVEGETVWGITHRLLSRFLKLLRD